MMRTKTRFVESTWLMILSQFVLAAFLVFWLLSQYHTEKRELKDTLLSKLTAAQTRATDSSVLQMLVLPLLNNLLLRSGARMDSGNAAPGWHSSFGFTNPLFPDTAKTLFYDGDAGEHGTITFTATEDPGIKTRVQEKLDSFQASHLNDTGRALIQQGVELIVGKTATLADSTQMMILNGDTATMRRFFQQSLAESGMGFRLYWAKPKTATTDPLSASADDLLLPVGYVMNEDHDFLGVTNYKDYLLKRLWPQALFALTLLGITGAAFLLAARSLRQQRRLSLMKEELVGNMSHELKTPVATVKVALEALGDEEVLADRATVRDYLSMAAAEVTRLELLINQTLHTSLLEQGRMRIHPGPVDLRALLQKVVQSVQLRADEAAIRLQVSGDGWTATGDALHLQGVVLNLLDNALKYAGSRASITVSLDEEPQAFRIRIADDGPGIPEAYLNKVFDKFFRVPTANRHDVKGYGLGLSYAAQVLRQHGGAIRAANGAGGGAVFTILLPKKFEAQ